MASHQDRGGTCPPAAGESPPDQSYGRCLLFPKEKIQTLGAKSRGQSEPDCRPPRSAAPRPPVATIHTPPHLRTNPTVDSKSGGRRDKLQLSDRDSLFCVN
eukprot:m.349422 g.349422  ORF g.349422 m.349422 type:complete len:101 (+) comp16571_c1_seq9:2906-3208(+)